MTPSESLFSGIFSGKTRDIESTGGVLLSFWWETADPCPGGPQQLAG